jgi:hypothetical protein
LIVIRWKYSPELLGEVYVMADTPEVGNTRTTMPPLSKANADLTMSTKSTCDASTDVGAVVLGA